MLTLFDIGRDFCKGCGSRDFIDAKQKPIRRLLKFRGASQGMFQCTQRSFQKALTLFGIG